jgi:hypothetical protein
MDPPSKFYCPSTPALIIHLVNLYAKLDGSLVTYLRPDDDNSHLLFFPFFPSKIVLSR